MKAFLEKAFNQTHQTALLLVFFFITSLTIVLLLSSNGTFEPSSVWAQPANTRTSSPFMTIHRYESPKMDAVNLYWLETNEGIIIVDTGRFLSQARYALEEIQAQASSNKLIIGILLTHPHTDHYGGLPVFAESAGKEVPIYASQITYDDMKNDGQGFIRARKELHGNDFPNHDEIPLPNRIVKDGEEIQLGGLTFQVIELPKNETLVTTLYYLPKQGALFAGDIVTNKSVPFLGDGHSENWVKQLQMLLNHYPKAMVYHGHGEPGLAGLLMEAQIQYIETLRNLVTSALGLDKKVTSQEKANIVAEMKKRYPDYNTSLVLPGLLERGIDAIAEELTKENA
jgi:glyoxylase-like metal-dependent hydrolase (beta-lactamase superfamily II)